MKKRAKQAEGITGLDFLETSIPEEINQYVDKSKSVADYINNFVKSSDFKQKDIATKLGKYESEISKWFSGFHNLTLNSIIKLESVSSIKLLNPVIFKTRENITQPSINETARKMVTSKNLAKPVDECLDSLPISVPPENKLIAA